MCAEARVEGDWWAEERRGLGGVLGPGTGGPGEAGHLTREPEGAGRAPPSG